MLRWVSWILTEHREGRVLTSGGNLLAGSRNTDNDTLTPALVAGFEGSPHDADVACAVEGVVAATVGHLDQLLLNGLAVELGGVDEVGGTELASPGFLAVIHIDGNDHSGLVLNRSLNNRETNAASTEDSNVSALLNTSSDNSGTVPGGDTAAQQARSVRRDLGSNSDNGDVGYNGVLREGGGTHEVEDVLSTSLEARSTVRHHALTLGGTDLSAEVGLSRLAELAFPAFGGVQGYDVVPGLDRGDALAYGFDNTGTLVAQNDGEGTLGILSGEGVGIYGCLLAGIG